MIGRVADVCRLCRAARPFTVKGQLAGCRIMCEACGAEYPAPPTRYNAVLTDRAASLEQLIEATHPACASYQPKPLSAQERWEIMVNTFRLNNQRIEKRFSTGDWQIFISTSGLVLGTLTLLASVAIGLAIALPSLVYLTAALATRRQRALRTVLPNLAVPLQPLAPTVDELRATLEYLQHSSRLPAARLLSAETLHQALTSPPRRAILGL
ncbi:MAG: hypothetical protein ACYCW6_08195 [Candidatus Xenobia bacterium]